MKKILFLSAAVAMASTSAAQANDFNGFRIEVQTGLDVVSAKGSYLDEYSYDGVIDNDDTEYESGRENVTGFQFGIGAGYDAEISPNIVAGIETSINFSNAKFKDVGFRSGTVTYDFDEDTTDVDVFEAENLKAKHEIELAARLGYKVNPSTLIYVKGGYVNGRFKINGDQYNNDDDEGSPYSYSKNLGGYRVGAGMETLLGSNAFAKLEYRYTNFKNFTNTWVNSGDYDGDYVNTETYKVGLSRHQVALGLGVRF